MKCQRFTPSGRKDIGIRKFEFVAKTQFLYRSVCSYFFIQNTSADKIHPPTKYIRRQNTSTDKIHPPTKYTRRKKNILKKKQNTKKGIKFSIITGPEGCTAKKRD